MHPLNIFERFLDWLFTPKYDCKKNKHRWGYELSDTGVVHLDDRNVPKEAWKCMDCGKKKFYNK